MTFTHVRRLVLITVALVGVVVNLSTRAQVPPVLELLVSSMP